MRTPEDAPTDPDRLIRFGAIASVDLSGARCTVQLDDGVTSPPLRWIERAAGATATWSPPSAGEQVLLLCAGGEIGAGVVLRGLSSAGRPPVGDSETEVLRFPDGAVLSYDPVDHALVMILPEGAAFAVTATSTTFHGDLAVTGAIHADGDITAGSVSLKTHKHGQVTAGTAQTGGPA